MRAILDLLLSPSWRQDSRKRAAEGIGQSPFYLAYPFHSPMPIKAVDMRGLIDDKLRVFYNRIPKAANTTLVFTIAKLRSGATPTSLDIKKDFRRPSQLQASEVRALDGFFKFMFVRNPYSRILSAYLHKIVRRLERGAKLGASGLDSSRGTPTFREFCSYLADGGLFENVHWSPQTSLMLLPFAKFDFIGKVETFENDVRTVLSRLGADEPADFIVPFSNYVTNSHLRIDDFYDTETRAIVRRLYRSDFETFDY
jgi:hypothetical protein